MTFKIGIRSHVRIFLVFCSYVCICYHGTVEVVATRDGWDAAREDAEDVVVVTYA